MLSGRFNQCWSRVMYPNTDKEIYTKRDLKRLVTANNDDQHNRKRLDHKGNEYMFDVQKQWETSKIAEYEKEYIEEQNRRKQQAEMDRF